MLIPTDSARAAYLILEREGNITRFNPTTSRGEFEGGQRFQIFDKAGADNAINRLKGYAFTTYRLVACKKLGPHVQNHIDMMVERYRKIA